MAVPLAQRLKDRGLRVWLAQWELELGDGLRDAIEKALSKATFGVVIVSPDYMRKAWTTRELDGLFSIETVNRNVILPVLHNVSLTELKHRWPILANRLSCSTDRGLDGVADQIVAAVLRPVHPVERDEPTEDVLIEYRRRMLAAADRHDLLQVHYELEDFLRRFPAHPQGRLLLDQLSRALRYVDRAAPRMERAAPTAARGRSRLRAPIRAGGFVAIALVVLLSLVGPGRLWKGVAEFVRSALSGRPVGTVVITSLQRESIVRSTSEVVIDGPTVELLSAGLALSTCYTAGLPSLYGWSTGQWYETTDHGVSMLRYLNNAGTYGATPVHNSKCSLLSQPRH